MNILEELRFFGTRLNEFYATPKSAIRPLIDLGVLPTDGPWLEPFAGDGAIIRAVPEAKEFWALELRAEEAENLAHECGYESQVYCPMDLFSDAAQHWIKAIEPRVIITNPPNSRAFAAARLLREWCPQAWLAFLQPVGFGGGLHGTRTKQDFAKVEWLQRNCPDHYRLAERPDFSDDGSGGLQDYAWFIWPPLPLPGPDDPVRGDNGWEHEPPHGFVRREGVHRVLPPPGWKPSLQGVLV